MSIRRWVGLAVPNGSFASVSCATPSACVAAGTYTDGKGLQVPAAERWDGSRWSIITPQPGFDPATGQDHPPASQLSAVSCTSATNCIAVGSLTAPADGGTVSLIEQWNGSGWTVLSSPTKPSPLPPEAAAT